MKIGVFADPQDCSSEVLCRTRRPRLSYEKVRQVMEAFRQNGADYAVCMGDLTDREDTHEAELARLREIPACVRITSSGTRRRCGSCRRRAERGSRFSGGIITPVQKRLFPASRI